MSVHLLEVTPTDVSASALGLLIGAPAPRPLVELRLRDDAAGDLTLGVLGASHVVTAESAGQVLTEQVSCDAVREGGRPLPAFEQRPGYRFTSRTERLTPDELQRRAEDLRQRSTDRNWLCAAFPGDDTALTVLTATAADGEWRWKTWHLYPETAGIATGTVVETEGRWRP